MHRRDRVAGSATPAARAEVDRAPGAGYLGPLVDRPAERMTITEALTSENFSGAMLIGPPGVGKTTLMRTFSRHHAAARWVACTRSSRAVPLGVFAPWLTRADLHDPLTMLTTARQSLLGTGEPPLICVDDAHLLDPLSATLLHHIAVSRSAPILAAARSNERVPDSLTSLWKDSHLLRVDLEPLSKAQSAELVCNALGGNVEELSMDILWEATGGSPLFLRHLLDGARHAGTLTEVDGVWQLRGRAVVTSGLAVLLDEQLRDAGAAIDALRLLALCEPIDIDLLAQLCGTAAVDSAESQGLIRVSQDGPQVNARFTHPLYGDVIRRSLGTATARQLRSRLTAALRQGPLDSAAARIRLALLSIDSDQQPDNELLAAAAKDALALADLSLAERLARDAFEHGDGLRSGTLLARALVWQGRSAEAGKVLTTFIPDDLNETQLLLWGIPLVSTLFWSVGDVDSARATLELLRSRITEPARKLILDACGAAIAVHENDIDEGYQTATAVLANPIAPSQAVDFAAFAAGLAMPIMGRGASFPAIAHRCLTERQPTDGLIRLMIRYFDIQALTYLGLLDRADQQVVEYATFSSDGQYLGWAIAKATAGLVSATRGLFPRAIAEIVPALAALRAEAPLPSRLMAQLLLARSHAALGQFASAEETLADIERHFGPQVATHEPQVLICKAWLAAARGAHRTAADLAQQAAARARRFHQYAVEAEALHHATRFGDRTAAARLSQLAMELDGDLVVLYAEHAVALTNSNVDQLVAVSERFEDIGVLLSAVDSAAQAVARYEQAGTRGVAADLACRVSDLARRCGGVTTPAIRSVARPLPLSSREYEIASLVAEGLSNRDIAGRLGMSIRTVEGHIYRACNKVGAGDRDELAALVHWPQITE